MTCEFGTEIEVKFLESGLVTFPSDVDIRSSAPEYQHAQVRYGEIPGQVIAKTYLEAEPVIISYGGNEAHRFYIPAEAIEFRNRLGRETISTVTLQDAIQVLSRGTIERYFSSVTLREVVEYIFNNRNDPHDVLTGLRFASEEDAATTRTEIVTGFTSSEIIDEGSRFLMDLIDADFADSFYDGFNFDGVSPLRALSMVLREFSMDYRVETDGTLVIGKFGYDGDTFTVSSSEDDFTLSRYDVTTSANKTNAIRLRGALQPTKPKGVVGISEKTKLQPVVEVSATNVTGSAMEFEARNESSLAQLQNIAARLLIDEMMNDVNGSVVINGLASNNTADLANLDVGDYLIVEEDIKEKCSRSVETGVFLVQRIHHTITPSGGWAINVQLSQVVFPDGISSLAFYFDPTTDQEYGLLDSYNENAEDDDGGIDFFLPLL